MSDNLFRKEALDNQQNTFFGQVLLVHPLSTTLLTGFFASITLIIVIFLCFASYTPREIVQGYLVPDKGLAKLYAPSAATITEVFFEEGAKVMAGDIVLTATNTRSLEEGSDIDSVSLKQIEHMEVEIARQIVGEESLWRSETQNFKNQIAGTEQEIAQMDQQLSTQQEKLSIIEKRVFGAKRLAEQGHLSEIGFQNYQEEYLTQKQQLEELQRQLVSKKTGLDTLKASAKVLPAQAMAKISNLKNQLSELIQKKAEVTGRKEIVIKAPISGIVTTLQVKPGQSVGGNNLLLFSIIPEDTQLYAELYVPTRAIGFVAVGQEVHLRYAAFPHEKFGIYQGKIQEITHTILNPNEISGAVKIEEPVYRVRVLLDKQTIQAYGKEVPLEAGMLVEADILQHSRSLLEWVLAPIYSFKGRLS